MTSDSPGVRVPRTAVGNSSAVDEVHARPASLWRRAVATLVDGLILLALVVAYLFVAASIAGIRIEPPTSVGFDAIAHVLHTCAKILAPGAVLAVVLGVVYSAVFAFLWGGRTPGRMIVGIRLVDARGRPPSPLRAIIRAVLSVLSFALLLAGFWMSLFDRHGQTLHDKLTRTWPVQPSL